MKTLVELAQGADLLMAEGYTDQRRIRFHLDVATLRQHAGRLGARRVILTHLSAELLARADELGWETASDGMTLELVGPSRERPAVVPGAADLAGQQAGRRQHLRGRTQQRRSMLGG